MSKALRPSFLRKQESKRRRGAYGIRVNACLRRHDGPGVH